MSKDNGGPAFPVNYSNERDGPTIMPAEGMTLRDYFAAKAMATMLGGNLASANDRPEIARRAYAMADAMLKERQQ